MVQLQLSPGVVSLINNPIILSLVLIPLALVFLDWVTGIASAIHRGTFDVTKVMDFFKSNLIDKYLGAIALIAIAFITSPVSNQPLVMTITTFVGMTGISTSLVGSIYANCREFLSPDLMQTVDQIGASLGYADPNAVPPLPPPASLSPALPTAPTATLSSIPSLPGWETAHSLPVVSSSSSEKSGA